MCGIFALLCNKIKLRYGNNLKSIYSSLNLIKYRGPDNTQSILINDHLFFGFHRLKINDLTSNGNQPMILDNNYYLICNGEIYNSYKLKHKYKFNFKSNSDCEIILHLYKKYGKNSFNYILNEIDGVFAFLLYDKLNNILFAARDPFGVKPLFIGKDIYNGILFSSEAKSLINLSLPNTIEPFPIGHYWSSNETFNYHKWFDLNNDNSNNGNKFTYNTESKALEIINENLVEAVKKRVMSDRPIGAFLSGGLDSSIIVSLLNKYLNNTNELNTYSIGIKNSNSIDIQNAKLVTSHLCIKNNHNIIEYTFDEGISILDELIYKLETYDVMTIRGSIGHYLLSKYISNNTLDIVLYSGEGNDEVSQGYNYFYHSPSVLDSHYESIKLLNNLCSFDVLRCDRVTSSNGLEIRVPFLDKTFVNNYLNINPKLRSPNYKNIEKYLIRKSFDKYHKNLLPKSILWRPKVGFSEGLSNGLNDINYKLNQFFEKEISDMEFQNALLNDNKIISKESLYYKRIYQKYFNNCDLMPYFWHAKWTNVNKNFLV